MDYLCFVCGMSLVVHVDDENQIALVEQCVACADDPDGCPPCPLEGRLIQLEARLEALEQQAAPQLQPGTKDPCPRCCPAYGCCEQAAPPAQRSRSGEYEARVERLAKQQPRCLFCGEPLPKDGRECDCAACSEGAV